MTENAVSDPEEPECIIILRRLNADCAQCVCVSADAELRSSSVDIAAVQLNGVTRE